MGIYDLTRAKSLEMNRYFLKELNRWCILSEKNILIYLKCNSNFRYIELFYDYLTLIANKYNAKFYFYEFDEQTEAHGYYYFKYKNNIYKLDCEIEKNKCYKLTQIKKDIINESIIDLDNEIGEYNDKNRNIVQ